MLKVAEAVDSVDSHQGGALLLAPLGREWARLTERMVGCTEAAHPWSLFVSARAVTTKGGDVVRTVPLPYPVRLTREEVARQQLLPTTTTSAAKMMMRCYSGSMTLTVSDGQWSPSLSLEKGAGGGERVGFGMELPPEEKRKPGATCRVAVTLEGLQELPPCSGSGAAAQQQQAGAWARLVADFNAAFFPPSPS